MRKANHRDTENTEKKILWVFPPVPPRGGTGGAVLIQVFLCALGVSVVFFSL